MGETASDFDPPRWAGPTILGSTILAAVSYVVGGSAAQLAGGFVVLAFLCILYVLYLWGQHREPPGGDGDGRREREQEAEKGGYGGSGGGG